MMVVRATAKLLKRLKIAPVDIQTPSTGRLGDWYCNIVTINKQQYLLCIGEKTLLPIVLRAKDLSSFPVRLAHKVEGLLKSMGIPDEDIRQELVEMEQAIFAKTASRKILGSMIDFSKILEAFLGSGASLDEASKFLADTPCGPLGMNTPLETTKLSFLTDRLTEVKGSHLRLVKPGDKV